MGKRNGEKKVMKTNLNVFLHCPFQGPAGVHTSIWFKCMMHSVEHCTTATASYKHEQEYVFLKTKRNKIENKFKMINIWFINIKK